MKLFKKLKALTQNTRDRGLDRWVFQIYALNLANILIYIKFALYIQTIIAEYVDHDETADLFYHCAGLGYHQESSKGLAEWVCKILKNWDQYKENYHCSYLIKKMFGVQTAVTCLNWYTSK